MCKIDRVKATYRALMSMIGILAAVMVLTVFLSFFPNNIITFEDEKFPVLTPVVVAGDEVEFQVTFYKHYDLLGVINRQLIDGRIYQYAPEAATLNKGFQDRITTVRIPSYVDSGKYYIRTYYTYRVNALNTQEFYMDTEYFEVIGKE